MRTFEENLEFENRIRASVKRADAILNFLRANPSLDCSANAGLLLEHISDSDVEPTQANLERAVRFLKLDNALAIKPQYVLDQQEADRVECQQRADAAERDALVSEIVADFSPDPRTRELEQGRLVSRGYPLQQLRATVAEIRERRKCRAMDVGQLREHLRRLREQGK